MIRKHLLLIITLISIGGLLLLYRQLSYTHITVQFNELRPMAERIPVYYKGIIIGKAQSKSHTKDYNHTLLKVVLYPKHLHLPINTEIYLKQIKKNDKTKDYLELIYPTNPSHKLIANGTYLIGHTTQDVDSYMKSQKTEDLDSVKQNIVEAAQNLNNALEGLSELFNILQETVKENQDNLKGTTENIKQTTKYLNETTLKINSSLQQERLEKTMNNIESSLNNIEKITDNFNSTSQSINQTIPELNSTIKNTQDVIANTNSITCGIRQTLRKKWGGLRLIFGRTIQENECCPCGGG